MRTAISLVVASLTLAGQQQPTPVFRARVDLVTVDVAVVDKDGKTLTTLNPGDFTIVADGRPRKVVSADYVSVATPRPRPVSAANLTLPAPTTNSMPPSGRTFLFVVDVDHIGQGGGKTVMKGIGDYLDRLSPDDRVGLVAAPYNNPRVDLTTNRQLIKEAAAKVVGANTRNQDIQMTVGEAAAVEQLDSVALQDYLDRIQAACHDTPPGVVGLPDDPTVSCTLRWQPMAAKIMTAERRRTQELFDSLRALAAGMAPIEGPKSIILVSEGIINDRETLQYMQPFATAAEKSRVTLYGLNLTGSVADVISKFNMTQAHLRDHQVLLDGMATLAVSARGNTFDVSGAPTGALARIDSEMSGYYLLS